MDRLEGVWAIENSMKINPGKSKADELHENSGEGSSKLFFFEGTKEFRKWAAANV
jgi:hypothetical protein